MTKQVLGGILSKLSPRGEAKRKQDLKNLKKVLDKAFSTWYNSNVPPLEKAEGSVPCKLNNERTKHQTCTKVQKEPVSRGLVNYPGDRRVFEAMENSSIND